MQYSGLQILGSSKISKYIMVTKLVRIYIYVYTYYIYIGLNTQTKMT